MDTVLIHTIGFLVVAILVAIIARRMRLPYTVGLVLTGIALAVTGLETGAMLTHDFIFDIILPPLLFEAALSIRWRQLRRDMLPVVVLSTLGVVISAFVVAVGMMQFLAWPAAAGIVYQASGTALQQTLKRDGYTVRPIKPKGDKVMRMRVHTPTLEAGKVLLKKDAPWLDELRTEVLAFPYGKHDDQVDALSQLMTWAEDWRISKYSIRPWRR